MSVDLVASLPRPVSLAAVLSAASSTLAELLGLDATPELVVVADRRYERGHRVANGRRLGWAELETTTIGEPCKSQPDTSADPLDLEIDILGSRDSVWLMVYYPDLIRDAPAEVALSPYRTCVGVVVATAVTLAIADLAGGEFIDDEIGMLRPSRTDPRDVIAGTRLPGEPGEFAATCERYLRQFPHLGGWPSVVSMP